MKLSLPSWRPWLCLVKCCCLRAVVVTRSVDGPCLHRRLFCWPHFCHAPDVIVAPLSLARARVEQVSEALGLPDIRSRQWSIQEASALKGKGLFEGFDW